MRSDKRRRLGLAVTAALALTPIVGDELIGVGIMAGETTSAQREKRRTGEAPNSATPKYVGALIIGMVAVLALQVIGLKGFVQH